MLLMQIVNTNSSIFSFQLEHSKYAHLNEQLAEASLRLRSVLLTFFFKKKNVILEAFVLRSFILEAFTLKCISLVHEQIVDK